MASRRWMGGGPYRHLNASEESRTPSLFAALTMTVITPFVCPRANTSHATCV